LKPLFYFSFTVLFLILSLSACEEEMPEPDELRVLEWTVDGERHKASCEIQGLFGCTAIDVAYYPDLGSLELTGGAKINGFTQYIYIYIHRGLELHRHVNISQYDDMHLYKDFSGGEECKQFRAINEDQRLLYISEIDFTNRIIEGYYEFEGINDCQDTLKIKDGYFKVSF